jgi:hypothetical protein
MGQDFDQGISHETFVVHNQNFSVFLRLSHLSQPSTIAWKSTYRQIQPRSVSMWLQQRCGVSEPQRQANP